MALRLNEASDLNSYAAEHFMQYELGERLWRPVYCTKGKMAVSVRRWDPCSSRDQLWGVVWRTPGWVFEQAKLPNGKSGFEAVCLQAMLDPKTALKAMVEAHKLGDPYENRSL